MKWFHLRLLLLSAALPLSACASGELLSGLARPGTAAPIPLVATPGTPRDAYAMELERTRPAAAVAAWESASRRALRSGLIIAPSFHERVRFPAAEPHAVGYRLVLQRGQAVRIRIQAVGPAAPVFADIFEVIDGDLFRHVHAAHAVPGDFDFVARTDAEHVLRVQPALDGGGTFDVVVSGDAGLLFPVAGGTAAAIGSWFGDPRDGGVRLHEGVDIFAPRGTPVLAVAAGWVTSTRPTPAGGRVVWLQDAARNLSYYYAHLDEQLVTEGQHVAAGDTVGRVGNTGNAQGVRPHLHFGVYRPGRLALDPAPLMDGSAQPLGLSVDDSALGQWARLSADRVRLRSSPSLAGGVIAELRADTPMLLLGGVGEWHRVVLTDGSSGFVSARFAGDAGGH